MKNENIINAGMGKLWIFLFAGFAAVAFLGVEVGSHLSKGKFRHEVDYKAYLSENISNDRTIDTLLLSDSVTYSPVSKYLLKEDVLDLTSNQAISLAGNFFLLQRFFRSHIPPRRVYLFFIYDLFFNDLTSKYTYLYFGTVFYKKDERRFLESMGRSDVYEKTNYFNIKKADLKKILIDYRPPKRTIIPPKNFFPSANPKIKKEMTTKKYEMRKKLYAKAKLIPFAEYFLNQIVEICKKKNVLLTLVVEPMPTEHAALFRNSSLYRILKKRSEKKDFVLVDVNEMAAFGREEFIDEIHLRKTFEKKYLQAIDEKIVPLLYTYTQKRLEDLSSIKRALERYRADHGHYPVSVGFDGFKTRWGKASAEWIEGLVPRYIDKLPRDPQKSSNPEIQYLYRSNGKDFKLIAHGAGDCKKVEHIAPDLVDPKRTCWAYGYWTEGAAVW